MCILLMWITIGAIIYFLLNKTLIGSINCERNVDAGTAQSLVVPAAALGVVGYGYMRWKVWIC